MNTPDNRLFLSAERWLTMAHEDGEFALPVEDIEEAMLSGRPYIGECNGMKCYIAGKK